jgi:hypothetical protein
VSEFDILSYKREVAPNFLCVYAGEKVGKSTVLATLLDDEAIERGDKIHIVDVDHGLEGFINKWHEKGKPIERKDGKMTIPNVSVDVVSNMDEFHEAVWTLPEGYKYYVIDTLTRAGKFFIKKAQPTQTPGKRAKNANMEIAFTFEDYIDRFEELAWGLVEQDAWLIINCHQKRNKVVGTDDDGVEPLLYGSAGGKLNRVTTGIWRLQLVEVMSGDGFVTGRQFRTAQTETIVAGDRTGALDEIEPANFAKCFKKIRDVRAAGVKEETA